MNLSTEKKIMDMENRLAVAKGEGKGAGWTGNLGLIDANYCLWNGLAVVSCCVALGAMSSHLWWSLTMWEKRMYTCMCNWVTMLYSRKKIIMYWGNKIYIYIYVYIHIYTCFIYIFSFFIMIFIFSIIVGLQCSVNFLLYSKVTQLHIHVHILFSHYHVPSLLTRYSSQCYRAGPHC